MPVGPPADISSLAETSPVPPLSAVTVPSSREEIDDPEIARLHTASALTTLEKVVAWSGTLVPQPGQSPGPR